MAAFTDYMFVDLLLSKHNHNGAAVRSFLLVGQNLTCVKCAPRRFVTGV